MDLNTALAPIVLFVYNRPEHTKKTLEALSNNTLAAESSLFIFCDGVADSASDENRKNNELVKEVIASKAWCGRVEIITSTLNKGLANSVISGVSQIIKEFGKVIVLEDDLITSTTFLEYMNTVSGFGFNVPNIELGHNSFFLPLTSTWGWGTWSRIWNNLDFECKDIIYLNWISTLRKDLILMEVMIVKKCSFSKWKRKRSVLGGSDFIGMHLRMMDLYFIQIILLLRILDGIVPGGIKMIMKFTR